MITSRIRNSNKLKRQYLTFFNETRRNNTTVPASCKPFSKGANACSKYVYMDPRCKVALITGGTSGIGYAAAEELLCNDLYRVVITDVDTCKGRDAVQKLNSQYGPNKSCFMQLDTYKESDYYEVIQKIIKIFGNLDILINNPGIPKLKTWEEEVNSKLTSTIRATIIGTEMMLKQKLRKGGAIINIASALAYENFPAAPIYVSSNIGVIGFTKAWGAIPNHLNSNLRVITMCPGNTEGLAVEDTINPQVNESQGIVAKMPIQTTSSVGRGIVYVVQYSPGGTVWFIEGGTLYRGRIPKRPDFSQKVTYV